MGKVFTWIEIARGTLPRCEDFPKILARVREVLAEEPSIAAAAFCGSVARGDYNFRSDIDCVVTYRPEDALKAFKIMQMLTLFAAKYYVHLSFVVCDTRLLKSRMHHFRPTFVEHVSVSIEAGGCIKGDPLQDIGDSVTNREGIEEYLRYKMHKLQEGYASYYAGHPTEQAKFLQKVLEAPNHAARMVLSWQELLNGDSKAEILASYAANMPIPLVASLHAHSEFDKKYTEEMKRQRDLPDMPAYNAMLNRIVSVVPPVIDFVAENLFVIEGSAR